MSTAQDTAAQRGLSEHEPLLGRAGDASQPAGKPLYHNLILGSSRLGGFQMPRATTREDAQADEIP